MVSFHVSGMSCGHCVRSVTQAVKQVDELAAVTVDLTSGKVNISSEKPASEFKKAISDLDYGVEAI